VVFYTFDEAGGFSTHIMHPAADESSQGHHVSTVNEITLDARQSVAVSTGAPGADDDHIAVDTGGGSASQVFDHTSLIAS